MYLFTFTQCKTVATVFMRHTTRLCIFTNLYTIYLDADVSSLTTIKIDIEDLYGNVTVQPAYIIQNQLNIYILHLNDIIMIYNVTKQKQSHFCYCWTDLMRHRDFKHICVLLITFNLVCACATVQHINIEITVMPCSCLDSSLLQTHKQVKPHRGLRICTPGGHMHTGWPKQV